MPLTFNQGSLIMMCAGDEAVFQEIQSELDLLGKASFFLGPVGNASKMKLGVNMVMGEMMAALSEGIGLTSKVLFSSSSFSLSFFFTKRSTSAVRAAA